MKPELKKAWVDALRSGEYQQTTGYLKTDEGYCCLGVLCDISNEGTWRGKSAYRDGYEFKTPNGEFSPRCVPSLMRDALGLSTQYHDDLAERNDGGATFEELAAYIEEHL